MEQELESAMTSAIQDVRDPVRRRRLIGKILARTVLLICSALFVASVGFLLSFNEIAPRLIAPMLGSIYVTYAYLTRKSMLGFLVRLFIATAMFTGLYLLLMHALPFMLEVWHSVLTDVRLEVGHIAPALMAGIFVGVVSLQACLAGIHAIFCDEPKESEGAWRAVVNFAVAVLPVAFCSWFLYASTPRGAFYDAGIPGLTILCLVWIVVFSGIVGCGWGVCALDGHASAEVQQQQQAPSVPPDVVTQKTLHGNSRVEMSNALYRQAGPLAAPKGRLLPVRPFVTHIGVDNDNTQGGADVYRASGPPVMPVLISRL